MDAKAAEAEIVRLATLAMTSHRDGALAEAAEAYGALLVLKPDFAMAWANLAAALSDLGRLEEAVAAARRAVQLKPGYADALNNLGTALTRLGRRDEAAAAYRQAIAGQPAGADAYTNLLALLDGQDGEAIEVLRQMLSHRPDDASAHVRMGNLLAGQGRRDEAQAHFGRARALLPGVSATREPYRACPLCDGAEMAVLRTDDCSSYPHYHPCLPPTMTWLSCAACGHVFTDGWFGEEALSKVFSRTWANQAVGYDVEGQRAASGRMVARVARHVAEGAWLDVGFGNGSLLFAAAEWGFQPVGVDLRQDVVAALARLGIEAHCRPVEQLGDSGRFSVVSMADVLEHMPFPRVGLAAAARLLRPGGVLMVSFPSMGSMAWRMLDAAGNNPYWAELEHYHNFSRDRLCLLLRQQGFTPVEYAVSERYRLGLEIIAVKA